VCVLLLCAGGPGAELCDREETLVGTKQSPRCCRCHRRFKSEPRRGMWPAIKHHPRCPPILLKQESAAAAAVLPRACSRKRRAVSDPGELLNECTPSPPLVRTSTRRVTPPVSAQTSEKQRITRQEERIMRLLDETHARRMAAEEAAAAAATADERGTTHTGFTLAFVP